MMSLLANAEAFLLNNGRLLERKRFSYLFKNGSRDAVLTALKAYQNADGGFGNALEPDKRTASSQPIDQEMALRILDEIGLNGQVVKDICDFLQTITTPEGGVPFVLPTVSDAPRAPWWNPESDVPPAALNPTASIAGLLHKHKVAHPWLNKATSFCWQKLEAEQNFSEHDFICILLFLEHVPERERAGKLFKQISDKIIQNTALDPEAEGYVQSPLIYAPRPNCWARSLYQNEDIDAHLDALSQKQQEDGGWAISWPAVSPGSELEYRGVVTLQALTTLKAYGRLA
ncbi:MAG: hypothetical protein KC422_16285 [Trueperaceae bacterium]|nr:hypothetical protein [Trueperaceae bacterium]